MPPKAPGKEPPPEVPPENGKLCTFFVKLQCRRDEVLKAAGDEAEAVRLATEKVEIAPVPEKKGASAAKSKVVQDIGPPTVESLGLNFSFVLFGTAPIESPILTDATFEHTFEQRVGIDEEFAVRLVKEGRSSVALKKAGVEAPLVVLPFDLRMFLCNEKPISQSFSLKGTTLADWPFCFDSFEVLIKPLEKLLIDPLEKKINPLTVTIARVEKVPAGAVGGSEEGNGAYCTLKMFDDEEAVETKRVVVTGETANFSHSHMILAGLYDQNQVRRMLESRSVLVELHDGLSLNPQAAPPAPPPAPAPAPAPAVDKKAAPAGKGRKANVVVAEPAPVVKTDITWSGLETIDQARAEMGKEPESYGSATADFSELGRGARHCTCTAAVRPVRLKTGSDRTPKRRPYIEMGTLVSLKASIAHPLSRVPAVGKFQRIIFCFKYENSALLQSLLGHILSTNAKALGITDQPVSMLNKILSTMELSASQRSDENFDIITGFHVVDASENRILVLEGLADQGIRKLVEKHGRSGPNSSELSVLFNETITFPDRLYSAFNANLRKIKLRSPLRLLVLRADIYLEPKYAATASAILRLFEMSKTQRMAAVRDLSLFPTVEMLENLDKKCGDTLSLQDIDGSVPPKKQAAEDDVEGGIALMSAEELEAALDVMPRRKYKAPTEHQNPVYMHFKSHPLPPEDFVSKNIERVRGDPKPPQATIDYGDVYIYSGQKLNFSTLQAIDMRKKLGGDRSNHYTYSKDLLSGAFVMVDLFSVKQEEEAERRGRFLTEKGFVWPAAKLPHEYAIPDKVLTQAQRQELAAPWIENIYHPDLLPDPSPHDPSLPNKKKFNVYTGAMPQVFEKDRSFFTSVHQSGTGMARDLQQMKDNEFSDWTSKLKVSDTTFRTFAKPATLSQMDAIDKTSSMLKDPPMKRALVKMKIEPTPVSILSTEEAYSDPTKTFVKNTYGIRTATLNPEPFHTSTRMERKNVLDNLHRRKAAGLHSSEMQGQLWAQPEPGGN